MGTLSNKERIEGILMRSRQAPPVVDPFADLAPPTQRSYTNPGRLLSSRREEGTGGGVSSLPAFAPPDAPPGSVQPFNSDEAWNAGPGFRRGRTRPAWWPDELDAYREEDPPQQSQWLEGAPQQSAASRLIDPQRGPGGNNDVWGQALRDARVNEGMPADADNTPLDQFSLDRLEGEAAEQRYSPLGEEWGWLDVTAGLGTAIVDSGPDLVMQYFDEDANERMRDRRRYLAGAARGALDVPLGDSGDLDWDTQSEFWADREGADGAMDWIMARPGHERRADVQQTLADMDARSAGVDVAPDLVIEGERPSLATRALAFGEDLWQGPSIAARGARRDAVTGFAMADTLREQGDEAAAREQERRAGQSAATDALITGSGALELAPGVGLIDTGLMAGRFAGRQPLRALGVADEAMPYWMRATEWSPTATFRGRADEALHDPGMLTRQGAGVRDRFLLGSAAIGAGAYAADELMDGEGGDLNQAAGGALATAGALAGARQLARGRGVDPLADIAPRAEVGAARELDNGTRVYEDGYARTTIEPDGRIVHTYQGGFTSGSTDARATGSGGEAVSSMRAAQRALERDISETQRPAYRWFPGEEGTAPDPALQEFYRRRFQQNPPAGYVFSEDADGTMHLNRVVEADATTAPARRFEAAIRDPETGRVYTGEDHYDAIASAPDDVQARLSEIYEARVEDPSVIGFQVDGQFMGREEGLQALRAQRRPVRIGEQVNRDGSVTPRSPIDWENGSNRLPADDEWFNTLAGMPTPPRMNIVSDGGIPGRSADDMLRDGPDAGQVGAGNIRRVRELDEGHEGAVYEFDNPSGRYNVEIERVEGDTFGVVFDRAGNASEFSPVGSTNVRDARATLRAAVDAIRTDAQAYGRGRYTLRGFTEGQRRVYAQMMTREALPPGYRVRADGDNILIERAPDGGNIEAGRAPDAPNAGPRRLGDDTTSALAAGGIGAGAALAFSGEAEAEDGEERFSTPRYMDALDAEGEQPVPEIPALMRTAGAVGTGLIARNFAGRLGLRGAAQELPGAAAAYGTNAAMGGDPLESIAVAGATPLIRYAGEEVGSRALAGIDDYLEGEGRRSLSWTERDHAIWNDPYHQQRVREFAATLPGETPSARVIQGENFHADVTREVEGLPPLSVGDREAFDQGFYRDIPGTGEISPRDEFLAMKPHEQEAWMDRQQFEIDVDPARVEEGVAIQRSVIESAPPPVRAALEAPGQGVPRNEIPPEASIGGTRPRADGNEVSAALAEADEMVTTSWGANLQARRGQDYILTDASGDRWVVRADIFDRTYEPTEGGRYRKSPNQIVGYWVSPDARTINTLEGPVEANAGDYIMVGSIGEMWPVRPEQFARKYETSGPADPRALDDIAPAGMPPMNRRTRGERTPDAVLRRASTRPAGPTMGGFIEAAAREGVTITPSRRGNRAMAEAIAEAVRNNPRLEQLARDWGLSVLLTAGGVAAMSAEDDPLAGVAAR